MLFVFKFAKNKSPGMLFKRLVWPLLGLLLVFSSLAYTLIIKPAAPVRAATNISDGSNFGGLPASGHQIVKTSGGVLYAFLEASGSCQIWRSPTGATWTQQDSSNAPACNEAYAAATDSGDTIHLGYVKSNGRPAYTSFNTSTNLFSGTITEICGSCSTVSTIYGIDMAVDTNNKVHAVYAYDYAYDLTDYDNGVHYTNNISGSWTTPVVVNAFNSSLGGELMFPAIAINEDNAPEIAYVWVNGQDLEAEVGNGNNASSFTSSGTMGSAGDFPISITVDGAGNTFIQYLNSGDGSATLMKHNDSDSWSTWQTISSSYNALSAQIIAVGDIVNLFYVDSTSQDIVRVKYSGSWYGSSTVATGTYTELTTIGGTYHLNETTNRQILFTDDTDIFWETVLVNSAPDSPIQDSPPDTEFDVPINPTLEVTLEDVDSDYLKAQIVIYQSDCSTVVRTVSQTSSQTGWTGQNTQSGTAYTSGSTAYYTYQSPYLNYSTTYCWKTRVIDPGGSNSYGPYSSPYLFDTASAGSAPSIPTLIAPQSSATNLRAFPVFQLRSSDANNNSLQYKIEVCSNSDCSSVVRTIDQTGSQSGWSNQNQSGNTAYTGSSVISGSTIGVHTFQNPSLTANTQYWWRAYAIDPGGSNTWSSASSIQSFTISPVVNINILGGSTIRGGAIVN